MTLSKHEMVIDKDDYEFLVETNKQLEKAMNIIANTSGDYTQNIVYDALVDVGYYEPEEEDEEE